MALLTAGIAFVYRRVGVGAVGLLAVVLFVCQYLLRAGIQAYDAARSSRTGRANWPRCRWGSSALSSRPCRCATR